MAKHRSRNDLEIPPEQNYESGGQGFESLPAHHYFKGLSGIDRSPAAANSPLVRYHQRAKFKTHNQFRVFAAQFLVV
jgi:hypothetical protein